MVAQRRRTQTNRPVLRACHQSATQRGMEREEEGMTIDDPMSDLWDTLKEALGERLIDLFFKERYDTSHGDTFKYTLIVAATDDD